MRRIRDLSDRVVRPHPRVESRELADGRVQLTKPKGGAVVQSLLRSLGLRTTLSVTLDPIGSAVWRLLDGRRTADVLDALGRLYPDEWGLAERLGEHLGTLVHNRLAHVLR